MTAAVAARRSRGGLWRHRDFRVLWFGETTSQLGTSVSSVALPLVAVDTLRSSAFIVTVLTASVWLPWLILGLPAGGWVDRVSRRPLMLLCDAVSFVAFISVPVAVWLGLLGVAQLVVVAVVAGGASVFFRTAYQAYLPAIIDGADLIEGNAKLTGSQSAAKIAGPGLGGAIVQLAGASIGLLANAASFAVSFACLSAIRRHEPRVASTARTEQSLAREVRQGLRFVLGDSFLRPLLFFGPPINLFLTGISALTAVFLVRTVGITPGVVGLVFAAESAGGVLGAVVARPLARRWGSSRTALLAVTLSLPFALLLPLTTSGAGLLLFVGGLFMVEGGVVIANVIFASFYQAYVPPDMLGRVTASTLTVSGCMMPAGALVAGGLSQALGIRPTLWILTAGIAASGLAYLATPMRKHRDFPIAPDHATR